MASKVNLNNGRSSIYWEKVKFEVDFKPSIGGDLVVLLHGALNREKRRVPFFQPFLPIDSSQISISDPTLECDDLLESSWFLGGENNDLILTLVSLIKQIKFEKGFERIIFVGGSAGGFASLLCSSLISNSLAIVGSPQIDLVEHGTHAVSKLAQMKGFTDLNDFRQYTYSKLTEIYSKPLENYVVCMVSNNDTKHLYKHIAPFMLTIKPESINRVIFEVGFWGIFGHSGSVPKEEYVKWINIALHSRCWDSKSLLEASTTMENISSNRSDTLENKFESNNDLQISLNISQYLLSKSGVNNE
ncbi:MAG: hypothetical protein C0463_00930 [Idiomarina sp.]|nr:hypothetical protein [Idiomarina sp.]